MKIATWNVNSIRARQERLLAWLQKAQPDTLCLQETKVTDDAFPYEAIRRAGYHAAIFGQKTYNGVAILSRQEPRDVHYGLDDGIDDREARLVAAEIDGIQVLSVYVPNGQVVGSEKYAYKLGWFGRLGQYLARRFTPATPLVLCGDFNVAWDEKDVAHPDKWANSVLFYPEVRRAMDGLCQWGLVDVFRHHHPDGGLYSWWDYRLLSFPRNDGLRLDYVLPTEPLAARSTGVEIDREERKGQPPSDHAPVIALFS